MKFVSFLLFALFLPFAAMATGDDFTLAAQLLSAAKNADTQKVQVLISSGADINFIDSTGLSLVCTALMNNDTRAVEILQMYGADASKCDRQIKEYNDRNKPKKTGGFFSGLSTAQGMTLAVVGVGAVVGGLLLLTDVFDPGNDNDNGVAGGGGNRPGGGGGGGGIIPTASFELPYGPAMPNAALESANYANNLNFYSPSDTESIYYKNFDKMNDGGQNYLLMMHGYSPLARGYLGMRTLRLGNNAPMDKAVIEGSSFDGELAMGGRPVDVALITANGVNATDASSLMDKGLVWTTVNGTGVAPSSIHTISSKYYNNLVDTSEGATTYSATEDRSLVENFDLSGHETAINNINASDLDNLLAKIVGGSDSGYATADFFGFMPNGQMMIFRTGGGKVMLNSTGTNGTYLFMGDPHTELATGDKLGLFNAVLEVTRTGNIIKAEGIDPGGNSSVEHIGDVYNGYIGADGLLYISSTPDGEIDSAYKFSDDGSTLIFTKALGLSDYSNYLALSKAALLSSADSADGRSKPDILANVSVIEPLRSPTTETISDILQPDKSQMRGAFANLVNQYYQQGTPSTGTNPPPPGPGVDAVSFFNGLGSLYSPITIFSAGNFETDSSYSGVREATFENAAPLAFDNLDHLFMSIVAIAQVDPGTTGTTSISGYTPQNKYALAQWKDTNGTDDEADDRYYKARTAGIAGKGLGNIDPWAFAATGVTDEFAVAAAAGAVGAIKSAFYYLDNKQVFTLLALTADGPFLATNTNGTPFTRDALIAHLKDMYILPPSYQARIDGGEDYLEVFKEVFGYGLINLERATKPTSKLYFFDGNKISSANGNAYWRSAANTSFHSSPAFNPRSASVNLRVYDVLESFDGSMRLPRIWNNEIRFGTPSRNALYMGDVLADFGGATPVLQQTNIGNFAFSMSRGSHSFDDDFADLDNLQMNYSDNNLNLSAKYQRYFTDGASRFDGLSNPVLALASNALSSEIKYSADRWNFGARAFSGAITNEGLLENDPTISSQFRPARLGLMNGAESSVGWTGKKFGFTTAIGFANETNTILGAQSGGLLNLGAGKTTYIDTQLRYVPTEKITFKARSTFARTHSDGAAGPLGLSDLDSNAFALGADIGNFSFSFSRPLSVTRGTMTYPFADYEIVENGDGDYDLLVHNAHRQSLDLTPVAREMRFTGSYRHKFGKWTDGALGFIYRVNPNNTGDFGNETILMLKLTHRLGI